jgi:hypothetical protein
LQEGQIPLPLHESAIRKSLLQPAQCASASKIRCQTGRGETAVKAELPFSAFDFENKTIDRSSLNEEKAKVFLTDEFFQEMKTDKQTILDEIFLFIKHYETLKSLYASAGKPWV